MNRIEATYLLNNLRVFGKDNSDDEVIDPTKVRQADTLIIAAALRDFAQDNERNISDRERAGELRGQVLAYGASMCQPVIPTFSEDCISRQAAIEAEDSK